MRFIIGVLAIFSLAAEEQLQERQRVTVDPGALFFHARLMGSYPLIASAEGGATYNLSHGNENNTNEGFLLNGPTATAEIGVNGYSGRLGYTWGMFSMVGGLNGNLSVRYLKTFTDKTGFYSDTDYYGLDVGLSFSVLYGRFGVVKGSDGHGKDDVHGTFSLGFGW